MFCQSRLNRHPASSAFNPPFQRATGQETFRAAKCDIALVIGRFLLPLLHLVTSSTLFSSFPWPKMADVDMAAEGE